MEKLLVSTVLFIVPVIARDPDVLCVYPLSGVYAPLQRILFYVLLSFGVIGRRQRWLVAGALASAMTYCGAAAIQSFFLIAKAKSPVVDLDIYGVFAVTSTGFMLTAPLLAWSTTLQSAEREIRMIISLWSLLIAIGAILTTAGIYIRADSEGPECFGPESDITSAVSTLYNASTDCTYACFAEKHPLFRSGSDALAWKNQLDAPRDITAVFVPNISASMLSAIIVWTWVIRKGNAVLLQPPPVFTRFELGWVSARLFGKQRGRRDHAVPPLRLRSTQRPEVQYRFPKLVEAFQYYFVLGSSAVFIVNLVMNEVRLRSLPTNEMPYEVGQWGPWVGVGLILLAELLNRLMKRMWPERATSVDEEELPIWSAKQGPCQGDEEGWKVMNARTNTMMSEVSTIRRRNSF
ncbi:hypothetical protein ASPCAL11683 [Aspergillus calidoustus]|uniref:Integral membrane protein n=1 Tax=Aspergillus calidoustus TaxID=454130 RepID=A0A0U5G9Q5_ASPCI|nr:hypothetical protein ASPCAL11683 [Aspergillus calidoustus]